MSKTRHGFSLNSFISPSQSEDWYKKVSYKDSKNIIREKMISSAENFVAIGYHLKHIKETGQYKEDGYTSIWECAKNEFGFSQSKASRFIKICNKYSIDGDSPYIDERFKNFDKSQLQEMLPIEDERLIEQITPDMSTREIRNLKNAKDTKDGTEDKIIQGQIQFTTIEGEYRELESMPVSDEIDEEASILKQDTISEKTKNTENNTKGLEKDLALKQDTDIAEEKVETSILERVKVPLPCIPGEIVYFYYEDSTIQEGIVNQVTLRKAVKTQFRVYAAELDAYFFFEATDFDRIIFLTESCAIRAREELRKETIHYDWGAPVYATK